MLNKRDPLGFQYAFAGIYVAWNEEKNFKIQIGCAAIAIFLAWFFGISRTEWMIVIFLIGFVLAAEALNTALEELCDMYKTDLDPHIEKIKDLAAAAVLISSITALIVGLFIFVPYLL